MTRGLSRLQVVRLLLQAGADVNRVSRPHPFTALAAAFTHGKTQVALALIFEGGADLSWFCRRAGTAMNFGRLRHQEDCVAAVEVSK